MFHLEHPLENLTLDGHALVRSVAARLKDLANVAASYLDLFIDRARISGDHRAMWWLDEVELRRAELSATAAYALHFTLAGDDGGMWTVDMVVSGDDHRPDRIERRQG